MRRRLPERSNASSRRSASTRSSAVERLAAFHRVENTYLSTFQALGGLGLLLGTVGLSAIMFRNVLERRRELALLRAVGYDAAPGVHGDPGGGRRCCWGPDWSPASRARHSPSLLPGSAAAEECPGRDCCSS